MQQAERQWQLRSAVCLAAFCFLLFTWIAAATSVTAQQEPMHHDQAGHEGMNMQMDEPMDPAAQAKLQAKILADKKESEFNHHLAGFFVVVAGVFIFFRGSLVKRWPVLKYVWPACFLLAGLFVLVWSDTELWPFGHRQWLEALQHNREVLQHKTFAMLLLALGTVEWRRTQGALKARWAAWVFPIIAVVGSVILIFHQHEGGMIGEHHMETMERIQSEHMSYLVCGLGIGLTNGLSELKNRAAGFFGKIWPLLMIVLGVLLMFYKE
jgi:putative copper resistance protein D